MQRSKGDLTGIPVAVVLMAMTVSVQYPVAIMTIGCRVHSSYYHGGCLPPCLKMGAPSFGGCA